MKKNFFENTQVSSSLSLEHHLERLALEASVLNNVIENLKSIVPSAVDKLSLLISNLKTNDDDDSTTAMLKKHQSNVADIVKVVNYNNFATFDRTLVTVPEGFQGDFLTYASALVSVSREIYSTADESLGALKNQLSLFISNYEVKMSNKDKTSDFKKVKAQRESIESELGRFFSDKNVRSKAYMSETIGRFEDVDELYGQCKVLLDINSASVLKAIESKANEVKHLLVIVLDDANNNPDTKVSGAAAMNIAAGAYEVAKCVELVGIFKFRISQLYACVSELITQLKKILSTKPLTRLS